MMMVSFPMAMQVVDLCSRQRPDQQMVRIAFKKAGYNHSDLMIPQYPKILSLDLLKLRLPLPPAQGATAKSRILHSDQALPTMTRQRSRMIVWQSETDILETDREWKETGRNVTRSPV